MLCTKQRKLHFLCFILEILVPIILLMRSQNIFLKNHLDLKSVIFS